MDRPGRSEGLCDGLPEAEPEEADGGHPEQDSPDRGAGEGLKCAGLVGRTGAGPERELKAEPRDEQMQQPTDGTPQPGRVLQGRVVPYAAGGPADIRGVHGPHPFPRGRPT